MNSCSEGQAVTPIFSKFADDPDFAELLNVFANAVSEHIQRLQGMMQSSNFEEMRELAHQLKGAGGGYGFPELSEAAHALESACEADDREMISKRFDQLTAFLNRIAVS